MTTPLPWDADAPSVPPMETAVSVAEEQPAPLTPLQETLKKLRDARAKAAAFKAELTAKQAEFAKSVATLVASLKAETEAVSALDETARLLAVAHFQATKEKKPTPGIEVKLGETMDFDHAQAFAWATAKGMCITPPALDVDAFMAVAEAMRKTEPLPFVTFTETPKAQIAKDLDKALGGGA